MTQEKQPEQPSPPTSGGTIVNEPHTGTVKVGTGPGSTAALERALNDYLMNEINSIKNQKSPELPKPDSGSAPIIIRESGSNASVFPPYVAVGLAAVGLVSGAAYLIDRRKKKK